MSFCAVSRKILVVYFMYVFSSVLFIYMCTFFSSVLCICVHVFIYIYIYMYLLACVCMHQAPTMVHRAARGKERAQSKSGESSFWKKQSFLQKELSSKRAFFEKSFLQKERKQRNQERALFEESRELTQVLVNTHKYRRGLPPILRELTWK